MKLADFDYNLPKELIAQYPSERRDGCRLMIVDRKKGTVGHHVFGDICGYFGKDDLLVLNDTKVLQARLFGKRVTGGKVELFLIEKKHPISEALVRPSGRLKEGEVITLESGDKVEVLGRGRVGRLVKFNRHIEEVLKSGHVPLPPYIDRMDEEGDKTDYQTIYASKEGATASPTAGLHFTKEIFDNIRRRGADIRYVTLHTNYGTFAPVKTEIVEDHKMHRESFEIPEETMSAVKKTKAAGNSVFAVGTTSARSLEYWAREGKSKGDNDLFIYPGFDFKVVDHLITNFHLPKSTLMLLVSAFAGRELILEAYRKAVEERYRFFSYGDAMLIV